MRRFAKRALAVCLAAVFLMMPITGAGASMKINEIAEAQIGDLTSYIKGLALSNGALPMNAPAVSSFSVQGLDTVGGVSPEEYTQWPACKVVPYFSSLAILGLLKSSPAQAKETAERFIDWYISHLNDEATDINGVDGTVYDYYCFVDPADRTRIIEVTLRKLNEHNYADKPSENPYDYDSTDSYAACFLRVLYAYYQNYGGDFLADKKDAALRIVGALRSTYVSALGLTGAKPNYMVCYLMDNCEVYDGLAAASALFDEVYGDSALATELQGLSETVKSSIETHLWSQEHQAYYPYVFADGVKSQAPDLSVFYPDATAQLFAVSYGLIEPTGERAKQLYSDFNAHFGTRQQGWHVLKTGDAFPWASVSGVAAKMQDYERLEIYIQMIQAEFGSSGYAYPFYNSEAGAMLSMYDTFVNSEYYRETYSTENEPASVPESDAESETVSPAERVSQTSKQAGNGWKYLLIGGAITVAAACAVLLIVKKKKNQNE